VLFRSTTGSAPQLRIDGSLELDGKSASIHRMGAKVQELDACNGWTFWHFNNGKELIAIDELRKAYRSEVLIAEA